MANQRGVTIWCTGLSGSGKSTVSKVLEDRLRAANLRLEVLDGDEVRTNLSKGLGFSKEDRDANIRRIGFVAHLLTRNGVIVIVPAISPYRAIRDEVRARIGDFVEVHISAPLSVCEERDVKGLYKKARAGEIKEFTGVSDPYEEPLNPEVICNTQEESPEQSTQRIIDHLVDAGYLPRDFE